jgi:hypothetical protein
MSQESQNANKKRQILASYEHNNITKLISKTQKNCHKKK